MKPGFQTTEFWLALGSQVVLMLVLFGVVTPEDSDALKDAVTKIVTGVFTVASSVSYIVGRYLLKKVERETEA